MSAQPAPKAYSVSEVNRYISSLLVRDFVLRNVTVRGEVSNCKYHNSGHLYFTLKDSGAAMNCIMFARDRETLSFRLRDGQQVDASGQVSLYEKAGSLQLYVKKCTLSGEGALYEEFLRLKARLQEMGMFDPMYKKPVPRFCRRVGIVTAPTGAAVRDIIQVSKRRNPYAELILYPAKVQGEGAAQSIARGIRTLDAMGLDVIIVGRGGGSIEDLWAFNEEITAQAIFEASTPIISAVGHETDFTIADFAADLRAPTPSAAAELANFEYDVLMQEMDAVRQALRRAMEYRLGNAASVLEAKTQRLRRLSPRERLRRERLRLKEGMLRLHAAVSLRKERASAQLAARGSRLETAMDSRISHARRQLELRAARLDAGSPLKKLSGGFGYVTDEAGRALRSVKGRTAGDAAVIRLRDGKLHTVVTKVEADGGGAPA